MKPKGVCQCDTFTDIAKLKFSNDCPSITATIIKKSFMLDLNYQSSLNQSIPQDNCHMDYNPEQDPKTCEALEDSGQYCACHSVVLLRHMLLL